MKRRSLFFRLKYAVRLSLRDMLVSLGILLAFAALSFALQGFDPQNNFVSMLFLLAVFLIATVTDGYVYGIASSFLSVLLVNYLFTYPYFRFNFTLAGYPIAIVTMLAVSITTSALTSKAKRNAVARLEAEREKTRSNLLRAVSHDLRTPLTGILGASSALLEHDASISQEERRTLLQDIHHDAGWLIRMVENLLTITRMDNDGGAKVNKTPEAGEEILESAAAKFRKQYPGWKLSLEAPQEFFLIPMDAILIEQVLLNLMENAVHHAQGGNHVHVSLRREGGLALFEVRDNGAGIDPQLLPKIFQTHLPSDDSNGDQKRNMGIGLSVCRTIIRAHGGDMDAENAPAGGAVFRFTLPLEEDTHEQLSYPGGGG